MISEEYSKLIYLLSCAVNQLIPENEIIDSLDYDSLFRIASFHRLTSIVSLALKSAGVDQERFEHARKKDIWKYLINEEQKIEVINKLEKSGIRYCVLKGEILKHYYPKIEMRQMSDIDILYDNRKSEEVRRIMEELGFSSEKNSAGHQDDYIKPPVSHFEMHRELFTKEENERFFAYYNRVFDRLIKNNDNEYSYRFTKEDFYIYLVAHEFKHYTWRGTGLRSVLDIYVYLKNEVLDWGYILNELAVLDLVQFEETNRKLADKLFSNKEAELSEDEIKMLEYLINSGAYGLAENEIKNGIKQNGKLRYIMRRLFPPSTALQRHYPIFYKYVVLIPLLPFYRIIRGWKRVITEIIMLCTYR